MDILLILIITAVIVWAVAGAVVVAVRDGYHHVGNRDARLRTPVSID